MTAIKELQQDFQHAVVTRTPKPSLFVRDQAESGVNTGFDIYANAYRIRLAAALRDNYPMLHLALGDDMFGDLAVAYIEQQPSRFRSIRWFGDNLAGFMDASPELTPHSSLSDLARMDWTLRQSFDAADDDPLLTDGLARLTPEAWPLKSFRLRAATLLLQLRWRIEPVWQALNRDAEAETDPPEPFEHTLLVWRNALDCQWRSLGCAEAAGLTALAAGEPFAHICECMMTADETITPTAAAVLLRQWIESGLLARE